MKLPGWSLASIVGCLLACVVEARNWTVLAPLFPTLLIRDGEQITGLLPQLLNITSDSIDDQFTVLPVDGWFSSGTTGSNITVFDQGAIDCIMKARREDDSSQLCLFQSTPAALAALQTVWNSTPSGRQTNNLPSMTTPWLQFRPTILVRCVGDACAASSLGPETMKAMYFLRVFHSGVWSLLLLFALTAGSLLFVFEFTHPFQMGMQHRAGTYEGCFSLWDSFLLVFMAMLLQPYKKTPKSWAGMVLVVFWYAFALICVIAYASGAYRLIFQPIEQLQDERLPPVVFKSPIACEQNSFWCQQLASSTKRTVVPIQMNRDASGRVDPSEWSNGTWTILVDHVTARQIQQMDLLDDNNKTVRWLESKIDCGATDTALWHLPSIWWTFVATDTSSAWAMNYYIQRISTSGEKQRVLNHWLESATESSICLSNIPKQPDLPIRLLQMNGPLLFMIIGALLAVVAHFAEFIYLSFIVKKSTKSRPSEGLENLIQ